MSLPDSGLLGYGLDQSGFSRVLQKDFLPSFPFRGRGSRGPGEGDCRHPLTLRGGAFDIIFLPEGPDVACMIIDGIVTHSDGAGWGGATNGAFAVRRRRT